MISRRITGRLYQIPDLYARSPPICAVASGLSATQFVLGKRLCFSEFWYTLSAYQELPRALSSSRQREHPIGPARRKRPFAITATGYELRYLIGRPGVSVSGAAANSCDRPMSA